MADDYTEQLADLRDRAYRIVEAARQDDEVPDAAVARLETGLELIEMGWETVENHPHPEQMVPYDLDAQIEKWDRQFSEKEEQLGIA